MTPLTGDEPVRPYKNTPPAAAQAHQKPPDLTQLAPLLLHS